MHRRDQKRNGELCQVFRHIGVKKEYGDDLVLKCKFCMRQTK